MTAERGHLIQPEDGAVVLAADSQPVARATDGFLAPGAPLIRPSAFEVTDPAWAELEML